MLFPGGDADANANACAMSSPPELGRGEVHLWHLNLAKAVSIDTLQVLAPDECARAHRFVFDRDRNRYIQGRFALRTLLGRYLDLDPASLTLTQNAHGKPMLDRVHELGFNLSHSGDMGLVAVSRAESVGVDLEETCAKRDMRQLAISLFSPEEKASIDSLADDALTVPFLTCWTRKEACLKALGVGLTVEPSGVHAGIDAARLRVHLARHADGAFVDVETIVQDERCIAAVAVAGGFTSATFQGLANA